MTAQQMRSPSREGVARAADKIAQLLPQTPLLEAEINGHTVWCKADSLQPMDDVDRRRALVTWSRLLGVPLELRTLGSDPLDGRARARLLKGQVLVEQSAPHEARVYALVSADEQLLLTAEIEQNVDAIRLDAFSQGLIAQMTGIAPDVRQTLE